MGDAVRESPLHGHAGDDIAATGGTIAAGRVAIAAAGVAITIGDVTIAERPFRTMFNLRGKPDNASFVRAIVEATGLALPPANAFAARDGCLIAWLGPDEFLLLIEPDRGDADVLRIRGRLGAVIPAFTEVGAGHTTIEISGAEARSLLASGCTLDLHPRALIAGQCLQTQFAGTAVLLLLRDDSPRFELVVRRSFADHLWRWLRRSAQPTMHLNDLPPRAA